MPNSATLTMPTSPRVPAATNPQRSLPSQSVSRNYYSDWTNFRGCHTSAHLVTTGATPPDLSASPAGPRAPPGDLSAHPRLLPPGFRSRDDGLKQKGPMGCGKEGRRQAEV